MAQTAKKYLILGIGVLGTLIFNGCSSSKPPEYELTIQKSGFLGRPVTMAAVHSNSENYEVLNQLWIEHAKRYAGKTEGYIPIDSGYVEIIFERNKKTTRLMSAHPLIKRNVIATETGLRARDPNEDSKTIIGSEKYRQFRLDFDAIIKVAKKLEK